jgi:hypothetical protein
MTTTVARDGSHHFPQAQLGAYNRMPSEFIREVRS